MLEKLLLAAFITLSLHVQFGTTWLNSKAASSTGIALQTDMARIILSQKVIK